MLDITVHQDLTCNPQTQEIQVWQDHVQLVIIVNRKQSHLHLVHSSS
jgi:hypothetical protein